MGTDFNSCRFDFRLDGKTGLLPSRRRRGCSTAGNRSMAAATGSDGAAPRTDPADSGGRCSTLYSCKICGCLLRSRADRKAHTLQHKQDSFRVQQSRTDLPSSESAQPYVTFGVTHPRLRSNHESFPVMVEYSDVGASLVSELGAADFDFLTSSFRAQKSTESLLPSAEVSLDCNIVTGNVVCDSTSGTRLSPLYFRSLDDDIGSCDSSSASGIASLTDDICRGTYSSDPQTDEVLDLTTKTAGVNNGRLPEVSTDDACKEDFRSPLVRQRKSRGLDLTVQKLWQFKLQLASACTANDVTFRDLERSRLRDQRNENDDDLGSNRRYNDDAIQTRRLEEERSSLETAVNKVTETRSSGQCEGHAGAELKLRRVVAAPGEHPLFYTSLMRLQATRRKSQPAVKIISSEALDNHPSTLVVQHPPQANGHSSSSRRGTQEKSASQVTCRACGHVAADADDLRSHLLATHGHELEEFRAVHLCAKCGRRFTSKASLAHHMNSSRHHAGVTSLRRHSAYLSLRHRRQQLSQGADNCRQTVERRVRGSTMTSCSGTGNSTEYAEGRVACEFPGCRREFRELKHLKVHRMQHTDERPLSCALCSYSCRQRNSLNWHMKSRHGLGKSVTDDGRTVYVSSSS